jgi:hypothetical protein
VLEDDANARDGDSLSQATHNATCDDHILHVDGVCVGAESAWLYSKVHRKETKKAR